MSAPPARRPVLVTGVPRSGTTWLARWLAAGRGMALTGREPMNPREGQYALARTLDGWARLTTPTGRQRRALRLAYRGLTPLVYSRYGVHQARAPLPRSRLVVKDPFALLSVPAVVAVTGALPVVVYRHPAAVLASYRRMGWRPDVAEVRDALRRSPGSVDPAELPDAASMGDAEAMARFWAVLHRVALDDLEATGTRAVLVAHHELATADAGAARAFAESLGVGWTEEMAAELARQAAPRQVDAERLHNFDRSPAEVAEAWRRTLEPAEVALVEELTAEVRARVDAVRHRFA